MRTSKKCSKASEYYAALVRRDSSYDGVVFYGIRTTGIFFVVPLALRKSPSLKTVNTSYLHKMHYWQVIDPANAANHFVYPPNNPNGWND